MGLFPKKQIDKQEMVVRFTTSCREYKTVQVSSSCASVSWLSKCTAHSPHETSIPEHPGASGAVLEPCASCRETLICCSRDTQLWSSATS